MVAPTRAPQVRGVKCDLCKKILATATWLDQTKLAKSVEEAKKVLDLNSQHQISECPCIPKSIENLLVGSTHFEIHRLIIRQLDLQVHSKQCDLFNETRQKLIDERSRSRIENINDCHDTRNTSRFRIYSGYSEKVHSEKSEQQLKHLCLAVDSWRVAMNDQTNPFNSKLALRLGLTHHVIYACYLLKYYKALDYQLIAADLLLNLFKTVEGVTPNAILHANYLLIRALVDCQQFQLARQYLKQATKMTNYQDKTHYESILLTCMESELNLLENGASYGILDDLSTLTFIQPDDKLQHYYARTLAISTIIKFIHCYPSRSELCFEYYHTFRYICAIIRRCYESTFDIVLSEKDIEGSIKESSQQCQILDHSWIRFAVCDFVFSTFEQLTKFYLRTGQPETLELLYNGLNLVSYRTGSYYWQTKMGLIGFELDILCDKYDHARAKLDTVSRIMGHTKDSHLMNLLRINQEVVSLKLIDCEGKTTTKEVILDLMGRIHSCYASLLTRISSIELYDHCSRSTTKLLVHHEFNSSSFTPKGELGNLYYSILSTSTSSFIKAGKTIEAKDLVLKLIDAIESMPSKILEHNDCQAILEALFSFANIEQSEKFILEAIKSSALFLKSNSCCSLESQMSNITISGDTNNKQAKKRQTKTRPMTSRLSIGRRSRRKGLYDVASRSEENLTKCANLRVFDTIETVRNFTSLNQEEIVVAYLRNSEPNPDYRLYRKAHEMLLAIRLKDEHPDRDQILFHFTESAPSNTMRYRWMMFEEQQISPFDRPKTPKCTGHINNLGFSNTLINIDKTSKSFTRTIQDDQRLLHLKHIVDKSTMEEHLLAVSIENDYEPIFVQVKRAITPEEFLENKRLNMDEHIQLTTPAIFSTKIDEAKKTLFYQNQRSRSEVRERIESEVGVMLHDIEDEWLGPFRFLLCGRIGDTNYKKFVSSLIIDIEKIMKNHSCNSKPALRHFIENAPLINRSEFFTLISLLFNCPTGSEEVKECFNKWLKTLEAYMNEKNPGFSKTLFLQSLSRGQLGLILEHELERIPFESLPIIRIMAQGVFRVPSLRLFSVISGRGCDVNRVETDETAYILDPANNLGKTRERFEKRLKAKGTWVGVVGRSPKPIELENWLSRKQIYLFIGHGAGTTYYNTLCKGRGLSTMAQVKPVTIVMGCSSGRVAAEGPRLESFGIGWVFVFRGSPAYVGLLWDVTDTDIDRFLDSLLAKWMGSIWQKSEEEKHDQWIPITEAISQARQVCRFKFLVGSTPVVYGIPVWCKSS